MGSFYDSIPPAIAEWILRQHIFFVATRALSNSSLPSATGHFVDPVKGFAGSPGDDPILDGAYANVSPKDMGGFVLVDERRCWYQDVTGSGVQTIAHLRQPGNDRLTIMFCAFEGGPRILRLFGRARAYERTTPDFEQLLPPGDERIRPGCRAIIELEILKVQSSCGFAVPFFDYKAERPTLDNWAKKRIMDDLGITDNASSSPSSTTPLNLPESRETELSDIVRSQLAPSESGMRTYWQMRNATSVEGLQGLKVLSAGERADVSTDKTKKSKVDILSPRPREVGVVNGQVKKQDVRWEWIWVVAALVLGLAIGFRARDFY